MTIHVMTTPQLLVLLGIAALIGCALGMALCCIAHKD
ncbi:hypothetical protein XaavBphi31_06 [Xanthomonas phage Xaa_vB_phi31]|uniref:Uncharacterized protein n=1 Tax=Xanthomonas phage Xaa_vB_phi31 TaxID=2776752 RepID=A0A868C0G6_9CAUD|nr:hypothetical protein XaavBphi31_06 [Xanthomonas phage Xaa_vB_phi31]